MWVYLKSHLNNIHLKLIPICKNTSKTKNKVGYLTFLPVEPALVLKQGKNPPRSYKLFSLFINLTPMH